MPTTTIMGHTVPTVGDSPATSDGPANIQDTLTAFSTSLKTPVIVASLAEANQLAALPDAQFPLFVYRTDISELQVKETRSGAWKTIGGEVPFAEADVSRTVPAGTTGTGADLHVNGFARRSEGWSTTGGAIVIPQTGLWVIQIYGNIEGITSGTSGRRFFHYKVGGVTRQKWDVNDDTSAGGLDFRYLTAGSQIMFACYQNTGASRVVRANVILSRLGSPRLV